MKELIPVLGEFERIHSGKTQRVLPDEYLQNNIIHRFHMRKFGTL